MTLSLLPTAGVFASTVYTYTGNDFTTNITGPYTTSDSIDGEITTAAPLAADLVDANFFTTGNSVTDYSFTDGVFTWDSSNAGLRVLTVSTDSQGNITQWEVLLGDTVLPQLEMEKAFGR